jgi:hypothetical protein
LGLLGLVSHNPVSDPLILVKSLPFLQFVSTLGLSLYGAEEYKTFGLGKKKIAKTFGLERYFAKFFYSIDIGWLKSDREFWATFLSSFSKAKPEEFVMIGDNPRCDVRWPNVLGMGTIQIETTETLSSRSLEVLDGYDKPNLYVKSLGEISKILLK